MSETWRVVLADGSLRDVVVATGVPVVGFVSASYRDTSAEAYGSAYHAIMRLAMHLDFHLTEVLAPGEPTRAELIAASAGVAERVREAAAEACEIIEDQPVRSDWYHGPYESGEQNGVRRCASAIRALDLTAAYRGGA